MKTIPQDTKKVFWKCGACSRTFFYLLNREFGQLSEEAERAADPLAGGILQKGHQCGMLWGAAMAVGAESYRRRGEGGQATALAIKATQHLVGSFSQRTSTVNCREVTGTDFSNPFQMLRYMLFRAKGCFNLAEQWAPEAIQAAEQGLAFEPTELPQEQVSCAAEVARKMGATEEEMAIVAGLAGGIGLSGQACGALGAAIWMNTLAWSRDNPGKSGYSNAYAKKTLDAFLDATDSKMLCHEVCGRRFETIEEHTEYVKSGGCEKLITILAQVHPAPVLQH